MKRRDANQAGYKRRNCRTCTCTSQVVAEREDAEREDVSEQSALCFIAVVGEQVEEEREYILA